MTEAKLFTFFVFSFILGILPSLRWLGTNDDYY